MDVDIGDTNSQYWQRVNYGLKFKSEDKELISMFSVICIK